MRRKKGRVCGTLLLSYECDGVPTFLFRAVNDGTKYWQVQAFRDGEYHDLGRNFMSDEQLAEWLREEVQA